MDAAASLVRVSKSYGRILALDSVDLSVEYGEVRALVGKNGAGKSTVIKLLSGAERSDSGEVEIGGHSVSGDPRRAQALGVATVFQELTIVPGLTVAENVTLGRWKGTVRRRGLRLIRNRELEERAVASLTTLAASLDVRQLAGKLPLAKQQLCEIARALDREPKVLILDEPTSSLGPSEVRPFLRAVSALAESGVAVLLVTHRLWEVAEIAHNITVLRDGSVVGTLPAKDASAADIAELMLGQQREQRGEQATPAVYTPSPDGASRDRTATLRVRHVTTHKLRDVSFDAYPGEVLGLAGLVGAGKTEVFRAVLGVDELRTGQVMIGSRVFTGRWSPRRAIRAGIALAPEDRRREGLLSESSVRDNVTMGNNRMIARWGILQFKRERSVVEAAIDSLGIKVSSPGQLAGRLSGGNQQKVVFARCIGTQASVLLFDDPTRGIDVGTKEDVYSLIRSLAREGRAIVVSASETDDLFRMCDRLLLMSEGGVVEVYSVSEMSPLELQTRLLQGGI
jgi:ABC-type sugar transport system ATPase subunit